MNKIKLFNPLVREIKELSNKLLLPTSPIEKLIVSSNRFLSLQNFTNIEIFLGEINLAFKDLEQYTENLRVLVAELNRYGKSLTSEKEGENDG